MALAVQSYVDSGLAPSGNGQTITNPSGLAVGDLMVSYFVFGNSTANITMPAGWTQVLRATRTSKTAQVAYKVADSSDVANNSNTFTHDGSSSSVGLSIIRVTGQRTASPVAASNSGNTNGSPALTSGITPVLPDSLLLMFVDNTAGTGSTIGSYAIATSNPTWTELFDVADNRACAWALRPQTTATGNATATYSGAVASTAIIVAISPLQEISTSDSVTTSDVKVVNQTLNIRDTVLLTDSVSNSIARLWTNIVRNVKTWTNLNKD